MTTNNAPTFIEPSLVDELDQRAEHLKPQSAFVMIGGAKAVVAVVEVFYDRLMADPQTAPFFERLVRSDGMSALKRHQVLVLVEALDGPRRNTGRDLYTAHRGLGITNDVYRRVCLHLLTVMHDFDVPMDILMGIDVLLRELQNLIVTRPEDIGPEDTGEETGQT